MNSDNDKYGNTRQEAHHHDDEIDHVTSKGQTDRDRSHDHDHDSHGEMRSHEPEAGSSGHKSHTGHEGHGDHSPEMFKKKFWLTFILTIPVLIYSEHIQHWFNFKPLGFYGSEQIPLLLSTFIFFYGGMVFIRSARSEMKNRKPGMMTLISLAIIVAYVYSLAVSLGFPGEAIFWELATLVTIMLLGHWLEMSAISRAHGALQELAKLIPDRAVLITENGEMEVAVSDLQPGDLVLSRPGSRVPADGRVVKGEAYVNEAVITGESRPLAKATGDPVIAGSLNEDGSLRIEVEKNSTESVLAGIMRLVENAQASRSQTQILADQAAFYLTFTALGAAVLTAFVWYFLGADSVYIMERVVTVLVIACPHALGLAIPLVAAISTTLAARNGLMVKDRLALERARLVDTVLFDKTGTLTSGKLSLEKIISLDDRISENRLLEIAAAAERDSEHGIARAVVAEAEKRSIQVPEAESFEALPGRGVMALIGGSKVHVGGPNLLSQLSLEGKAERLELGGDHGVVYVLIEENLSGYLTFSDTVRSESVEAVNKLQQSGIDVIILTGDSKAAAAKVAEELGIRRYYAEVMPEHKADIVRELKDEGRVVAMVGDGVNDAPALVLADIGLAIGAGTDVAVESAGIILVKNDPRDVFRLFDLSRSVYRKMVQNLAWATGYNLLAIPIAAGILAPFGFVMPMAVGAVVMSASTIIVALNAQLLRRIDLS